jgi:antitoxin component HigA of HigAB toxin-antitoxin module
MSCCNNHANERGSINRERAQALVSSIDHKINDLNQISFDCFFLINNIMKQNRSNAIDAVKMVSQVFELAGETGNPAVLRSLTEQIPLLKEKLVELSEEINNSLCTLDLIRSNFRIMPGPFRNLEKNLENLNTLLTEIKLTNVYKDRSFRSFSGEEAVKIHAAINKLKNSCPVFEENIFNISSHIESLYNDLSRLKAFFSDDLQNDLCRLSAEMEKIEEKSRYLLKKRKPVNQLLEDFNKQAGDIIEKIECRNLIRIRLNHIQNTQRQVLRELTHYNESEENGFNDNYDFDEVAKITSTQIDRLLFTQKEYSDSVNRISSIMELMGVKMSDMAQTLAENNDFNAFATGSGNLSNLLDEVLDKKQLQLEKYNDASNDMALVYKIVKELFERFKDLEMMENAIEQKVVDRISFSNLLISDEEQTASLAQQILKAYAGNHFEKNKIRTLFSDSVDNLKEFIENKSVFLYGKKGLETIHNGFSVFRKSINDLSDNLEKMESLLAGVNDKSSQILMSGVESIEKLREFDFSTKDMNELIGQFEEISLLAKDQKPTRQQKTVAGKKVKARVFLPAKYS